MKYGVLVVTSLTAQPDRNMANIGDAIQTEAILYLYEQMGIQRKDVLKIDINQVNQYEGEYMILPININLSLNWIVNIFPLPSHIIPVFLGLSYFSAEDFPQGLADYFRCYAPIGCRDEFTLNLMRRNHIPAYLFGCVTAVLPRRWSCLSKKKVLFVDVPDSFEKHYSNMNILQGDIENVSHILRGPETSDYEYLEQTARTLLERYCQEASVVVTSRLHCMSPCMAMGVPVIPVTDNISPRMSWIDRFLEIYTPETFCEINWQGQEVFYEEHKRRMVNIAIERIQSACAKYTPIMDWSYFLESRKKSDYGNYYRAVLKKLPQSRKDHLEYIIWGSGQIGINVYQKISEIYPDSRLIAVVDSYCEGTFFGVPIQKPDVLKKSKRGGGYVFIATTSGEEYARTYLDAIGRAEVRDYLSMATITG